MKFTKALHEVAEDQNLENAVAALKNSRIDPANPELSMQEQKANALDLLMRFWKLIRTVLTFAKLFTGEKLDMVIDGVVEWGDDYHKNHVETAS
jgi:hypothetical protein